jgi:HD-GYP domain-containing protein (c-di-GMP phosphodiesterase class II)
MMTNAKKQVSIDQLEPGMFVIGIDQSWLRTPFFTHRRLLKSQADIELLRRNGIRWVTIDTERGRDVDSNGHAAGNGHEPPGTVAELPEAPAADAAPPAAEAEPKRPDHVHADTFAEELVRAAEVRGEAIIAVQRIFGGVTTGVPIDLPGVRKVVASMLDRILGNHGAMVTQVLLQQLRRAGEDLFVHAVDTSVLSLVIGKEHGLDFKELEDLGVGALLHDIGQLRLPQNILQKRGVFTEEEHKLMQLHPQLGASILATSPDLSAAVHRVALEHHERIDGSGYPGGLRGDAITVLAQIVGLVDRYDAMAGGRDGATRLPPGQAIRQLYQAGTNGQFDATLVERLVHCLGVYPIGSLVELSTGERGVVMALNSEQRTKPSVKIITDARGTPIPRPWTINLSDAGTTELRRAIRRILDASNEHIDIAAYFEQ